MSPTTNAQVATACFAGKVLCRETYEGVTNLVVEFFDVDEWPDPEVAQGPDGPAAETPDDVARLYASASARVASAFTDELGGFRVEFSPRDFNVRGTDEQRPDLVLVVLAPEGPGVELEKRVLYVSRNVRWNAGSEEVAIILLEAALLAERGIPLRQGGAGSPDSTLERVSRYVAQRESEREFNAGVAGYHGARATAEMADRKQFRDTFVKTIATDFSAVPIRGVVLQDGDNIQEQNHSTFTNGIAKVNDAVGDPGGAGIPVSLYLTPAERQRLHQYFDNAQGEFVEIPESELEGILFGRGETATGALLVRDNPIARFTSQPSADQSRARVHTGLDPQAVSVGPTGPAGAGTTSSPDPLTDADIARRLARIVDEMPSADEVLQSPTGVVRPGPAAIDAAVKAFSLQKGPAENTAFIDFDTLQIAFDHVWKQLLDERIPNLAYTANSIAKQRFGIESVMSDVLRNGLLIGDTHTQLTPVEVPPVVARFFDITKEEFNELGFAMRDQLSSLAVAISMRPGTTVSDLRVIQSLTEQGDRLIDTVRHDDYYTLHKTLRDLRSRLNGSYEFTVFAADKDYHSVNFGLVVTYREALVPTKYQAGALVSSIPLAPKEERKYAVKVNRNEKRTHKEARKNNQTLNTDSTQTARVEAEIMQKAQTKTTFAISAEGDYDIGISAGKGTTSFGLEAIGESAQNRKDIREMTQKAARTIAMETNHEVVTESDFSQEYTESGVVINPSDTQSLTYLFYELQKCFCASEQVYRVMPAILVAQEMPLPNQITEAWVIAHDWIINRYLLDDSFRPTLLYLANNSVGDDFALRELRKNLRQQRSLVDTLRIEFSSASVEADNRYKAVETSITERIDEEHAERTDGGAHDIWDFFGGSGQDPEAAKARELAAQDAHQYAVQKAEKAAVALREELSNLHTLTDEYNKTLQTRLDNETRVERLLAHICSNITYYMHAKWSMEPPDQRYLRLYKVEVPVLELETRTYSVKIEPDEDIFQSFREPGTERHTAFMRGTLKHAPDGQSLNTVPLVEVADIDKPTFMGNYFVFPLKQHNALTEFMAAPYVDSAFGAMDPDQLSNVSLEEYSAYVCRLHDTLPAAEFEAMVPELKVWLERLLASPLRNGDEIVVPTHSLFIETMVDENSIVEIYKEKQRELDTVKLATEAAKQQIDNLRRAGRLLNGERGDPDFEKQTIVAGLNASPSIDVGNL